MSEKGEKLSEAELEEMEKLSLTPYRSIYSMPTMRIRRMVNEIRNARYEAAASRQAAPGLSEEDRRKLEWVAAELRVDLNTEPRHGDWKRRAWDAIALLDRLLAPTKEA